MSAYSFSERTRSVSAFIRLALSGENQDYTALPIRRAVILLAVPMILEMIMESVFALVDIFFVNRWLGSSAVSAVGLTESVITLVYSLAIGISMAATAMVARRIGEKDPAAAAQAAAQSLLVAIAVTVVISVLGVIFAPDILRLMGAEPATITEGTGYTRTLMGGSLVILLLFLINGIFRGAGNAFIAMKSLWLANICNIILCPICIKLFGLTGAAIATTAGRGIGVAYQLYHLFGTKNSMGIRAANFLPDWPLIRSLVKIAAPGIFQFIIASGSWIVMARFVAESGKEASAGYQTAIRVIMFFILPAWGLSNAATTLVGQNLGAKHPERAVASVLTTAKYNAIFLACVTALFLFASETVIGFFTKDPATKVYAIQALRIISLGYVFYGIGMVMANTFNGAGDTLTPTLINFIGFWLFQVPFAWLLLRHFNLGPKAVFIPVPVAETLIALMAFIMFKRGKWKTVKI